MPSPPGRLPKVDTPDEQVILESQQRTADDAPRTVVDQHATDADLGPSDLRDMVDAADDIDDESTPAAWRECRDDSQPDDAAIAVRSAGGERRKLSQHQCGDRCWRRRVLNRSTMRTQSTRYHR